MKKSTAIFWLLWVLDKIAKAQRTIPLHYMTLGVLLKVPTTKYIGRPRKGVADVQLPVFREVVKALDL